MIDKLLPYGYILNFGNKRIYDPNGLIEEPLTDEDITNHNKKLAQIEVENALKTGRAVFYIGYTQNPDDAYPWIKQYHVGTWDGSYRWNAYVKEKGLPEDRLKPVPPCKADGQLEVIVFDGCSLEDVSIGMIDFAKEKGSSPVKVSGRGHISYANKGRIEASGLDCAITIDAEFTLEGKFLKEGKKEPRIEIKLTTEGKNSIKYDNPELQIHYENSFPFDEAIIMTWKDESVFPPFEESLLHYVLHITKSK